MKVSSSITSTDLNYMAMNEQVAKDNYAVSAPEFRLKRKGYLKMYSSSYISTGNPQLGDLWGSLKRVLLHKFSKWRGFSFFFEGKIW